MKGVTNETVKDIQDIAHIVNVILDLTEDKRIRAELKKIRWITEDYTNE